MANIEAGIFRSSTSLFPDSNIVCDHYNNPLTLGKLGYFLRPFQKGQIKPEIKLRLVDSKDHAVSLFSCGLFLGTIGKETRSPPKKDSPLQVPPPQSSLIPQCMLPILTGGNEVFS